MLHHDGVTQGQEFEELQHLRILLRTDTGHEEMVFELELLFGVFIPAEIHRLSKNREKVKYISVTNQTF